MTKNIIITAIIALVVSLVVCILVIGNKQSNVNLGGLSERDIQAVSLKIGSNGTTYTKMITGTCNLVGVGGDAIAGGASKVATCSASQSRSGDKVFVTLPSVSGSMVVVTGAAASSTAGTVTVNLYNASSTVASAVTTIGTSTVYRISR